MNGHRKKSRSNLCLKQIIVTSLILFQGFFRLSGQSLSFDHYDVNDGVSQSEIICTFQDSEGFLWFGTQNGLNKFDGYTFVNYFSDPYDTTSLSNNWIFDITEDNMGCLWIATKNGLNSFDKKDGKFSKVNFKSTTSVISDNFVYGLCSDGGKHLCQLSSRTHSNKCKNQVD